MSIEFIKIIPTTAAESQICLQPLTEVFQIEVIDLNFQDDTPLLVQQCGAETGVTYFDLDEDSPVIFLILQEIAGDSSSEIDFKFFETQEAAQNDDETQLINSEIPFETTEDQTSVWVRISIDDNCFDIKEIILSVDFIPDFLVSEFSLEVCVGGWFNLLEEVIPQVLENPEDFSLAFFQSEADAEAGNSED